MNRPDDPLPPAAADRVLPYAAPPPETPAPKWPTVLDRVLVFGIAGVLLVTGLFGVALAVLEPSAKGVSTAVLSVGLVLGGGLSIVIGLRR